MVYGMIETYHTVIGYMVEMHVMVLVLVHELMMIWYIASGTS
jgi:hypothetical protein